MVRRGRETNRQTESTENGIQWKWDDFFGSVASVGCIYVPRTAQQLHFVYDRRRDSESEIDNNGNEPLHKFLTILSGILLFLAIECVQHFIALKCFFCRHWRKLCPIKLVAFSLLFLVWAKTATGICMLETIKNTKYETSQRKKKPNTFYQQHSCSVVVPTFRFFVEKNIHRIDAHKRKMRNIFIFLSKWVCYVCVEPGVICITTTWAPTPPWKMIKTATKKYV